ncbi:elongator complex protein 2-like [Palaemon carinicauda]|uniref:elongator complex protein 2-like n=1 Tax=Palaemon carinicauda TaxID=392227 RepID=UPI0035B6421F
MSDGLVIHEDGKEKLIIVTAATAMAACWIVCPVTGEREGRKTFRLPRRTFITGLLPVKVEEAKHPLLLCGDHDSRIRVFTRESLGGYFPEAVLNGHEDWVTSLDIMREDNGGLLLSSGPKDSSVRVWKVSVLEKGDNVKDAEDREDKVLRLRSVLFRVKPNSSCDKDVTISVLLDTILAGHGGLRSEVPWAGPIIKDGGKPSLGNDTASLETTFGLCQDDTGILYQTHDAPELPVRDGEEPAPKAKRQKTERSKVNGN